MKVNIALPYNLTTDEQAALLERDEVRDVNARIVALTEHLDPRDPKAINRAQGIQGEFLQNLDAALLARVTTRLVSGAVAVRYADKMGKRDRQTWKRLLDLLEEDAAEIAVSVDDVKWLVELLEDANVQDRAFAARPPFLSTPLWAEVLDEEVERLRQALKNPDAEVVAPAAV